MKIHVTIDEDIHPELHDLLVNTNPKKRARILSSLAYKAFLLGSISDKPPLHNGGGKYQDGLSETRKARNSVGGNQSKSTSSNGEKRVEKTQNQKKLNNTDYSYTEELGSERENYENSALESNGVGMGMSTSMDAISSNISPTQNLESGDHVLNENLPNPKKRRIVGG